MSQLSFDDGKDPQALRTIGEVADALGIKQHVLRYWEQQFPMLKPMKRSGGRRYYRPEDVALVQTIDRLVNGEGYTLKGAKQAIDNGKPQSSDDELPGQAADGSTMTSFAVRLTAIRDRLATSLANT